MRLLQATSQWIGSIRQMKFLEQYRTTPKVHYIYFIIIEEDSMMKIGRTSRLTYRLRNLRQSIYQEHKVKVIVCVDGDETRKIEQHLHKALIEHNVAREWFKTTEAKVTEIINNQYPHLVITDHDEQQPPLYKLQPEIENKSFNVA